VSRAQFFRLVVASAMVMTMVVVAGSSEHVASATTITAPPVLNPLTDHVPTVDGAAVQALESTAVNQVLQSHGLPSGDANAVLSWARADVRAAEFSDLVQIINEGAATRGGSGVLPGGQDQLVYNWFQGVIQRQNIDAAQQAINEFLRWSGQTSLSTASPLNYGPSQSFPGGYGGGSPVPTGFCGFSPPGGSTGPFAGTYDASSAEDCYIPCTDFITDCYPPEPDVSQFEQWGLYDAEQQLLGSPDYVQSGADAAVAEGIGLATAVGGLTVPIATSIDSSSVVLPKIAQQVVPFAVRAIKAGAQAIAKAASAAAEAGTEAVWTATEMAAAAVNAVSVSLVVGIVGVVIDFIISTVLAGITLNQQLTEPSQLQQILTAAQTTPPDLATILSNNDGVTQLFSAFITQTLPEAQTDCSVIPGDSCFTPPSPPAHTGADPSFLVTPASGGPATVQTSLYSLDPLGLYNNNSYLSGNGWFVTQRFNAYDSTNATTPTHGGATIQSLSLPFTDWSGNHWDAELVPTANGTEFALTPLDAANANACALQPDNSTPCLTSSIQVAEPGAGGVPVDVSVSVRAASPLNPSVNVAYVTPGIAGSAITFNPNGSDPSNLPLTYQWYFPAAANQLCTRTANSSFCGFTTSSSGTTTWTFPEPGDYEASVVATDSSGYHTEQSFNVVVTAMSSTTVVSSAPTAVLTQPVTFTATVEPAGATNCSNPSGLLYLGSAVTGSVQFVVDGVAYGNPVDLQDSSCTPLYGARSASITIPNLGISARGHSVTAEYLGTVDFLRSKNFVTQVVGPESSAVTITPSIATTVSGQPVSFRALVAPVAPGTGRPTGTVQFYANGAALGSAVPLGADATATSPATTALPANAVGLSLLANVRAVYSGDTTFPTSSTTYVERVNPDPTTTSVSSSTTLSSAGQPVTLSARVASTAPGSGTPSGCVQFSADGVPLGKPVPLDSSGVATLSVSTLSQTGAGTALSEGHSVSAQYVTLDAACQNVIVGGPFLTSSATLASRVTVLAAGASEVLGVTAPHSLSSAPFTFTFLNPVKGIDAAAVADVTVSEAGSSRPLAASIVCRSATHALVSCVKGPVSVVLVTPRAPLVAGEDYSASVDPSGVGVTSSVGNHPVPAYHQVVRAGLVLRAGQYPITFAWGTVKSSLVPGGSFIQDSLAGASVTSEFRVTSKSIPSVVLFEGPAQGVAVVTVSKGSVGVFHRDVDTYAKQRGPLVVSLEHLAAGHYTLRVSVRGAKNTASTGYAVGFDAIATNGSAVGGSHATASWSSRTDVLGAAYVASRQRGATLTLRFRGTGIVLSAVGGPARGRAQVFIDSRVVGVEDQYARGATMTTFSYQGLRDSLHTVELKVLGTRDAASSADTVTFAGATVS